MKVAIVYDRVNKWGGAERLLLALHKIFPKAPLYTSVYNPKKAPWAKVFPKVIPSFLQKFPMASKHHELYAPLMPIVFESFNFSEYDLVISVTSESAKGIITGPSTKHICIMLTPTRYLWSGYSEYFKNDVLRFISFPIVTYLRYWDRKAAKRPDKIISISKEVAKRVKKYYGLKSTVIYPPMFLSLSKTFIKSDRKGKKPESSNYFLIVSRMVPYKRIDLAIKVFNKLGLPLKIVGKGSQYWGLRSMAGSNIEFLGNLTDDELVKYYRKSIALIFPGREDFGLTILEAASFGKPVIAYGSGGAKETVIDKKTGIFFYPQTEKKLEEAVTLFKKKKFNPEYAKKQAQKFSFKNFKKEILENLN